MPKPYFTPQKAVIDEMIRVDYAGEYGAVRIYQGQGACLRNAEDKNLITHMLEQEQRHLDYFKRQMLQNNVRPSFFMPLWHILGYGLGAVSAMLGKKTAMLVTDAVEEVIAKHYSEQIDYLEQVKDSTQQYCSENLLSNVKQFREDELEHQVTANEHGSKKLTCGIILNGAVKFMCKVAIYISKRY